MQGLFKSPGSLVLRAQSPRAYSPRQSPRGSRNNSPDNIATQELTSEDQANAEKLKPRKVRLKIDINGKRFSSSSERQIPADWQEENKSQVADAGMISSSRTLYSPRGMAPKVIPFNMPRLTSAKGSSPLIAKRNEYGELDHSTLYMFKQMRAPPALNELQKHPHPYNNFIFKAQRGKLKVKRSGSTPRPHFEDEITNTRFNFPEMIEKMNSMKFVPITDRIQTVPNSPGKTLPTSDNINFKRSRPGYVRNQYGNYMKF